MAYTQSALQTELSKQREAASGWPWRLMTLSFIIFLTVVAVYGGMKFGFADTYLQRQLKQAETDLSTITKSVSIDEQQQIFDFYSQLNNIDMLLARQGKATPYLESIEKNTLKDIVYSGIDIKIDERTATVRVDGKTLAYNAIVQQIELYKKMPNVKEVKLSGARAVGKASDGILFSIQVAFNRS